MVQDVSPYNPVELQVRQRVRKRKISFGPRVADGAKAWDTFMSLAATTRKLGVNFYHYINDRISRTYRIPQLSRLIEERAKELNLVRPGKLPNHLAE